jgi:hypothetical protein
MTRMQRWTLWLMAVLLVVNVARLVLAVLS